MSTKLEQCSWLKLKQAGEKQQRVTEDWKRLAVWQHYRIGQLQGGFKPSAVDHSVRTINKTGAAKCTMRLLHRSERVLHNFGGYIEGLWKYELCRCAVSKVTAALPKLKFQRVRSESSGWRLWKLLGWATRRTVAFLVYSTYYCFQSGFGEHPATLSGRTRFSFLGL